MKMAAEKIQKQGWKLRCCGSGMCPAAKMLGREGPRWLDWRCPPKIAAVHTTPIATTNNCSPFLSEKQHKKTRTNKNHIWRTKLRKQKNFWILVLWLWQKNLQRMWLFAGAACSQSQMWCFLGVRLICEVLWSECCREETTAGCTQNNPFLIFGYCSQQQNNGHNQQQQAETSFGVDDSGSQNGQNELVLMTMAIWWIQLLTGISGTKILLAMLMSRCFGCIHSSDCQESVHQWGYWTDKSTTISCATESGIW